MLPIYIIEISIEFENLNLFFVRIMQKSKK